MITPATTFSIERILAIRSEGFAAIRVHASTITTSELRLRYWTRHGKRTLRSKDSINSRHFSRRRETSRIS